MKQPILVAYAGGAAATAALRALAQPRGRTVVTLTVDLGQGGELEQVREQAIAAGAARAHVLAAAEAFARDYALPALQARVADEGWRAIVQTLGEALVAARLQEIAAIEGAAIHPDLSLHALEANLLGRLADGGHYLLTRAPAAAPERAALVDIALDRGIPVAINEVAMPLVELIESLSIIAGEHGVGRVGGVEAPAAVVLHAALAATTHGVARMRLFRGACEPAAQLVTHT